MVGEDDPHKYGGFDGYADRQGPTKGWPFVWWPTPFGHCCPPKRQASRPDDALINIYLFTLKSRNRNPMQLRAGCSGSAWVFA